MRTVGDVLSRQSRPPRRRRLPDHCQACGVVRPPAELYFYVDGNNGSITANSPILCRDCYLARYAPDHGKLHDAAGGCGTGT